MITNHYINVQKAESLGFYIPYRYYMGPVEDDNWDYSAQEMYCPVYKEWMPNPYFYATWDHP